MSGVSSVSRSSVCQPIILTDPYKGSHVLRWSKSRGVPDTGSHGLTASREHTFTISPDDEATPFRLPRMSPRGDASPVTAESPEDVSDKVWSRYGFEKIIRIPKLGPTVKVLVPPPKTFLQQYRTAVPRFQNAAITPSVRSLPWNLGTTLDEGHPYRSMVAQSGGVLSARDLPLRDHSPKPMITPRLEPTPTPIDRADTPAKSVKSIHWVLGNNRYHMFDRKGRSHVQGPYSREFNVTCTPPSNWMRMKWGGKSRTMVH